MLTDWFPPGTDPVHDGVYITAHARTSITAHGRSECWHAMRWNGWTRAWFSADSTGHDYSDLIGADANNRRNFWWRGLAQEPQS